MPRTRAGRNWTAEGRSEWRGVRESQSGRSSAFSHSSPLTPAPTPRRIIRGLPLRMIAMYTLYYAPGSANLLVHLALLEIGAPHELKRIDIEKGEQRSAARPEESRVGRESGSTC